MTHYIIASHGHMAAGIYDSLKLIIGEQPNTEVITAYVDVVNDVVPKVKQAVESVPESENLVVFTDILGGSVNNEFMKYLSRDNFYLFAGMNLPLLMQLFLADDTNIKQAVQAVPDDESLRVKLCNRLSVDDEDEDF